MAHTGVNRTEQVEVEVEVEVKAQVQFRRDRISLNLSLSLNLLKPGGLFQEPATPPFEAFSHLPAPPQQGERTSSPSSRSTMRCWQ